MIVFNLDDIQEFAVKRLNQAINWVKTQNLRTLADGRYEIDGTNIFAMVSTYTTKPEKNCLYEGHRKYIDFQLLLEGKEWFCNTEESNVEVTQLYDEYKDICFGFSKTESEDRILLSGRKALLLFPYDFHKPCIAMNGKSEEVRKLVIKIAL